MEGPFIRESAGEKQCAGCSRVEKAVVEDDYGPFVFEFGRHDKVLGYLVIREPMGYLKVAVFVSGVVDVLDDLLGSFNVVRKVWGIGNTWY